MTIARQGVCITLIVLGLWSPAAWSGPFTGVSDWINANLIDPQDGKLDMSDYLASARGFLPIPIVITEPAVGFGLGAAVSYFHVPKELDLEQHPHQGPPSISVGFGAKAHEGSFGQTGVQESQ